MDEIIWMNTNTYLITCCHEVVVSIQNPEPLTQNHKSQACLCLLYLLLLLISDVLWWWQSSFLFTGLVEDVLERSVASAASMRWSSSRTSSMFSTPSKPSEITRLIWWKQWWDSCRAWVFIFNMNRCFLMCWTGGTWVWSKTPHLKPNTGDSVINITYNETINIWLHYRILAVHYWRTWKFCQQLKVKWRCISRSSSVSGNENLGPLSSRMLPWCGCNSLWVGAVLKNTLPK